MEKVINPREAKMAFLDQNNKDQEEYVLELKKIFNKELGKGRRKFHFKKGSSENLIFFGYNQLNYPRSPNNFEFEEIRKIVGSVLDEFKTNGWKITVSFIKKNWCQRVILLKSSYYEIIFQ